MTRQIYVLRIFSLCTFLLLLFYKPLLAQDNPEIFVPSGHTNSIRSFDLSPDGKYLISGSDDKTLKLWDVFLKKEVRTITLDGEVESAVFSPDGNYVLTGDKGKNLILWDFRTWKVIRKLKHPDVYLNRVQFSPDGRHALSAGGNLVYWDIFNGKKIFEYEPENGLQVQNATFSKDGKYIGLGDLNPGQHDKSVVRILNVKTGKLIKSFPILDGRTDIVKFSPNGKYLISSHSTGWESGILYVWDVEKEESIREVSFKDYIPWSIDFSSDGKYLAAGTFGKVLLYDAKTWNEIMVLDGSGPVKFSSNGSLLVYSHSISKYKKQLHEIIIKDLITGKSENISPAMKIERVNWADFDKYGKRIITVGRKIFYWDNNSGKLISSILLKDPSGKTAAPEAISDDKKYAVEKYVVNDEGTGLRLWDISTGNIIHHFPEIKDCSLRLRFSPDGSYLIAGSYEGEIIAFNLKDFSIRKFKGKHKGEFASVDDLAFLPNSKFVFSSSMPTSGDAEIIMWDIDSGNIVKRFTYWSLDNGLDVSDDGKHLLLGAREPAGSTGSRRLGNNVILQDIQSGKKLRKLKGHNNIINTVTFSANGKFAASGDFDGVIKLWGLKTGKEDRTLIGHTGIVSSIKFSPDDRNLISTSADSTTRLWDISTGKEIAQFISFTDGEWIVITPEGYYNSSANGDKHLNVSIGNRVYGIDQYRSTFYKPRIVQAALSGVNIEKAIAQVIGKQKVAPSAAYTEPPFIVIKSPEDGKKIDSTDTEISLYIEDRNQTIKKVKVFVNGRVAAGGEGRGIKVTGAIPEGGKSLDLKIPVHLDMGENLIEVTAFNGFSEGRKSIRVYSSAARAKGRVILPNLWILSIGINRYQDKKLTSLSYAAADAEGIVKVFSGQKGKLFRKINSLVINDRGRIKPTYENIVDNLNYLSRAGNNDVAILFIAGHGMNDDRGEFYFLPSDAFIMDDGTIKRSKAISWREIKSILDIPAKKLIFADTCHSEGVSGKKTRGVDNDRFVKELQEANAVIFTSSRGRELSQESDKWKHGAFTYALIEGIKGKADLIKDNKISMKELDAYVSETVPKITNGAQHPITNTPDGYVNFPVAIVK